MSDQTTKLNKCGVCGAMHKPDCDGSGRTSKLPPIEEQYNYERNGSHNHCWNQKSPACGQPIEKHTQCCLCDSIAPLNTKEGWAEFSDNGTVVTPLESALHNAFNQANFALDEKEIGESREELWQVVRDIVAKVKQDTIREVIERCQKLKKVSDDIFENFMEIRQEEIAQGGIASADKKVGYNEAINDIIHSLREE